MEIIPAIDIIDGKCVRLTQGDYTQKTVYHENPLEVAIQFEAAGLKRLHLVDLDGAKAGQVKNGKVLELLAKKTGLIIDFGGGIKTTNDLQHVFDAGAAMATIGSLAVKSPEVFETWIHTYGANKFMLGADVRDTFITISGWLEKTDISIFQFIEQYQALGITQLFCTDVSKDGKLEGPATALYQRIIQQFPALHFIASGGVSSMDDIAALAVAGCKGVIVGKAIYENRITLEQLVTFTGHQ